MENKSQFIDIPLLLLLSDLYFLRYEKPGAKWYELTDYLRDKLLTETGVYKIEYGKDTMKCTTDFGVYVFPDCSKKTEI